MQNAYTRTARGLHWIVAALLAVNVALGLGAESLPDGWVRLGIDAHKSLGITLLGLVLARLLWRIANPPPSLPGSKAARLAAHAAHGAMYAAMLAIPLTGWMHDSAWKAAPEHPMFLFGIFEWPRISPILNLDPVTKESLHGVLGGFHAWISYLLCALVALHLAAVAKHELVDRDGVLSRMWPRRRAAA